MVTRRALLALGAAGASSGRAQDAFPDRPLRLVIPLPPGGGADLLGRLLATVLGRNLGQPVVVENRAGAGGTIGSRWVAQQRPDGYTFLLGYTASHGINPALSSATGYDPVADFTPISLLATATNVLVTNPAFPPRSVPELIAQARRAPDAVRYASAGIASAPHLAGLLFDRMAGTRMLHSPYRGNGPALLAVLSGEVDLTFASLPAALQLNQGGRVRLLAVTSATRQPLLPDLPTIAETLRGFDVDQWYAAYGPPRLAPVLVDRLNQAFHAALQDPSLIMQLRDEGFQLLGTTSETLARHTAAELEKWRRVAAEAQLRIE